MLHFFVENKGLASPANTHENIAVKTLRDNVSMDYIIAFNLPSIIKENLLE
ncbi:MAG: hypothetical protein Q4F34_09355 [Prevotellaceae bacterium]|nr:hypothetical protein [Prevotellaceae bacterium]